MMRIHQPELFNFQQIEYLYRVLRNGPHIGLGGCGRVNWFSTMSEVVDHLLTTPNCDRAEGSLHCAGQCEISVSVDRWTYDAAGPGGRVKHIDYQLYDETPLPQLLEEVPALTERFPENA